MAKARLTKAVLSTATAVILAACGGESGIPTEPMGPGQMVSTACMSVSPGGGAVGVPVGTSLTFQWSAPIGAGMEQFIDLHISDLGGPVVPMSCGSQTDRTSLVCTPSEPLLHGTRYMIHVAGGMVDANGRIVDMDQNGPGSGGQWITGGVMGGSHAGTGWGLMGAGWRHPNGSYGMAFTFTTN